MRAKIFRHFKAALIGVFFVTALGGAFLAPIF